MKRIHAPVEHIFESYQELVDEIDSQMVQLSRERLQNVLKCKAGCDDCCMQFSVLPLEAAIIAQALQNSKLPVLNEHEPGKCRLLFSGLCLVYGARPIICRTQGMPLGYVDEGAGSIEVSACLLNFPNEYPLTQGELLMMDGFNQRLAQLNLEYCRASGIDPSQRIALDDLLLYCGKV